jgi:hypothetical protein
VVGSETATGILLPAATYVLDVYDCANGCDTDPPEGTPGDYALTVTIN